MIRKKNKFFTFIFATLFGAGQMYMGFMKQGLSIMTVTVAIIACGSWTGIGMLFLALPVLWFYSFFDAINKMTMPEDVFETLEDQYMFLPSYENVQLKALVTKYEKGIAVFLILVGGSILGGNILDLISRQAYQANFTALSDFISSLRWNGSRILFSVVIILIGVKMIIGKKKELELEEFENSRKERDLNPGEITAVQENTEDAPELKKDIEEKTDENA